MLVAGDGGRSVVKVRSVVSLDGARVNPSVGEYHADGEAGVAVARCVPESAEGTSRLRVRVNGVTLVLLQTSRRP